MRALSRSLFALLALCTVAAFTVGEAHGHERPLDLQNADPLPLAIEWWDGVTGHSDDGLCGATAGTNAQARAQNALAASAEASRFSAAMLAVGAVGTALTAYALFEAAGVAGGAAHVAPFATAALFGLALPEPLWDKPADQGGAVTLDKVAETVDQIAARQKEAADRYAELKKQVEAGETSRSEMKAEMDRRLTELVGSIDGVQRAVAETKEGLTKVAQDLDRPPVTAQLTTLGPDGLDPAEVAADRKALDAYMRARDMHGVQALGEDVRSRLFERPAGLVTGDDAKSGDAFIPETFVAELIRRAREFNPLREEARVMTISRGDKLTIPKQKGERFGARWSGRRRAASDTQTDETGTVSIPANKLDAEPKVTPEMVEDSAIDIVSYLMDELTIEFGIAEGAGFVNGDGVEQPLGFLSAATLAEITQFKSGDATKITDWKPLAKLVAGLPSMYSSNRAKWYFNRSVLYTLLTFTDEEGAPLWNFQALREGALPQFLGHDYVTLDAMPALDLATNAFTTGDVPIVFGDMREAYVIADKTTMVMRANPFKDNAFIYYYTMKRVGGQTVQPNALRALIIGA